MQGREKESLHFVLVLVIVAPPMLAEQVALLQVALLQVLLVAAEIRNSHKKLIQSDWDVRNLDKFSAQYLHSKTLDFVGVADHLPL